MVVPSLRYTLVLVVLVAGALSSPAQPPPVKGLLIVAPARFHGDLRAYVEHKRKLLPTRLAALEQALKEHHAEGIDDAERLKRFLFKEWQQHRIGYVLLVGDVDVLPVRYVVTDRKDPRAFNYAFYPCDLYYADLVNRSGEFDDWNFRKDGFHRHYFGEIRGEFFKRNGINYDQIDYIPDVAVGRWPVSSGAEVRLLADKTMAYERALVSGAALGGQPQAAFVTLHPDLGETRPLMDRLALALGWKWHKRYFADKDTRYRTLPPTEEQIVALLNKGVSLVVHNGHGNETSWEDCFTLAGLKRVKNADRLPIVFSTGCSTGTFAPLPPYWAYEDMHGKEHKGTEAGGETFTQPPPPPNVYQRKHNPTCLAEHMLRGGPDGCVAYIGCNTGAQPCAQTLAEGFVLSIARGGRLRLGDCWNGAIRHYFSKEGLAHLTPTDSWYPPAIFHQGMKFMLFGDPSLLLPSAGKLAK